MEGGIQLVFLGDFYQLPPINSTFIFKSDLWSEIIQSIIVLDEIYRQKDPIFQKILNEIRIGNVSDETDILLKSRLNLDYSHELIKPTKIFPRRDIVDIINRESLELIKEEPIKYNAITKGKANTESIKKGLLKLDKDASYLSELTLKVGAQVMLITNIDQEAGLVNGKVGIVVRCYPSSVNVRFNGSNEDISIKYHSWVLEGHESISRNQIPLILSYAVSIHKIQGATLESAYIDIGNKIFEGGQAYVALSRVKSLDSLYLHSYNKSSIYSNSDVKEYYDSLGI